jgi:hypothetical protein
MLGRILLIAIGILILFLILSLLTSYIRLRNKLREVEMEKYKRDRNNS